MAIASPTGSGGVRSRVFLNVDPHEPGLEPFDEQLDDGIVLEAIAPGDRRWVSRASRRLGLDRPDKSQADRPVQPLLKARLDLDLGDPPARRRR